ncbi:hypothetical protein [Burkholderia stabilis]|uniref:hypothetical protein n=1 Tax=Burkholderia stabilis TaxID=95485 RepID=UPI001F4B8FC2|nr:hypothetical protein [Burkholderia stabilis]
MQDAGRILTQNSVHYLLKNVLMPCILLRARHPGNPGPRNGTVNRSGARPDRPGLHDRGTIDFFRIRS